MLRGETRNQGKLYQFQYVAIHCRAAYASSGMPKPLIISLSVLLVLLGAALMYVIDAGSGLNFTQRDDLTAAEFMSIILSALGVILAAVTLMLGALAIVGWNSLESRAEKKVAETSRDFLRKRFSEEDVEYMEFVENIKEDVRIRILAFTRQLQQEIEAEKLEDIDPDA